MMLRILAEGIVGTDVELSASLIDWRKEFGSLNGPEWYRSESKLVVTGVTENRVLICIWKRILNLTGPRGDSNCVDWKGSRHRRCVSSIVFQMYSE